MYPQNQWYAAAWSQDVTNEPLARTICGEDIVLYRQPDGRAVALADRCWHRQAPLSMGRVLDNGDLQCPYHGLEFNGEGVCTRVPSQECPPRKARVRAFPLSERHRFVWVWIGDTDKVDERLIPDLRWNDHPDWVGEGGTLTIACNFKLLVDNLMDLTHETYVHSTTIGDEKLPGAPVDTSVENGEVSVRRVIPDHDPAPFWKAEIANALEYQGHCDRWQIIRFIPPSCIAIDVGVAVAGTGGPDGHREQGVNAYVINAITPIDERNTLYLWNFVRNFDRGNAQRTADIQKRIEGVFLEDVAMLEGQQRAMDRGGETRMVTLKIDSGIAAARRIIDTLI
ncbi:MULTISPECIES: aromatic ring-hydroxylating dioxygenase subunit alpha [unclassified Microbulbifer]|uniref:aromatic ring-hydroxylating dioxygenase subunit alpha n=1 Tax=unclassified Microbulbifer TaxID=2619833 RepID=UPI0027E4919C|nr:MULTISPECIES: aromatic ring-hydroxylating dioxygenase subunit alpha [unclassified Microbulbifer]